MGCGCNKKGRKVTTVRGQIVQQIRARNLPLVKAGKGKIKIKAGNISKVKKK